MNGSCLQISRFEWQHFWHFLPWVMLWSIVEGVRPLSLPPSLLTNVRTYALVLPPIPTFCRTILCYFSVDLLSSLLLDSVFFWEELNFDGPSWKSFLSSPCWQMFGLMLSSSQPNPTFCQQFFAIFALTVDLISWLLISSVFFWW